MTREEQIEKAALNYGHNNPYCYWNNDDLYEEDYESPSQDFKAGAEWADAHPDLYSVTRKSVEREREYLIRGACDWLRASTILAETTIERFKKAMEEQE